jgi:hypothetical protein
VLLEGFRSGRGRVGRLGVLAFLRHDGCGGGLAGRDGKFWDRQEGKFWWGGRN